MAFLHKYSEADEKIVFHEEDPDLDIIEIPLPQCPNIKNIDGYGKNPKDQKFKIDPLPQKLLELQNDDSFVTLKQIWDFLEKNQEEYSKEIEYIETQWERRKNGYWFFNNGKPTYITGIHYYYLQWWTVPEGSPQYRDRDRRWFIAIEYFEKDPYTLGVIYPKHRREGATTRTSCWKLEGLSRKQHAHGGIQSLDEKHAREIFTNHIVFNWRRMPFFFQPIHEGTTNPKSELIFSSPSKKSGKESIRAKKTKVLDSMISYKPANVNAYDAYRLVQYYMDECGKCLTYNTLVRLYDGNIKKVQDISVGDLLMGPDSKPRKVLSVTTGEEECFNVIPNKGDVWGCNRSHILSLKWCSKRKFREYNQGDTINMSVDEYLKLSKSAKKHMMLYRVGVEYKESKHDIIPPYILGLWLGDGSHNNNYFYNPDKEVGLEIQKYYIDNNYGLSITPNERNTCDTYRIKTGKGKKSEFIKELEKLNIYKNKHIPREYLIDTEKNRLELLAGLLDTDGSLNLRNGNPSNFEITKKRKDLSENIKELALSLGFYASLNNKIATLKRKNGSIYKCEVYRVNIYGDLYRIPTRVKRKQAKRFDYHKNRRNPLRSGFKVESIGNQKYYGFTLDYDPLFVLKDYTVTHNTKDIDVYERHMVVRQCLVQGSRKIGFSVYTSTVGEMDKGGGRNFKRLTDQSNHGKRNKNGMTTTGMVTIFMPANDGLEGYIDEFGNSIIESPTPEQTKYLLKQHIAQGKKLQDFVPMGAREFLANERESLVQSDDIEGLNERIRMYPEVFRECFRGNATECHFNINILERRLEHYIRGNKDRIPGDFEWMDGFGSKVKWVPHPQGKFSVSKVLDPQDANKFIIDGDMPFPDNTRGFIAGADPFKFIITNTGKKSKGAGAVFWKRDMKLDPDSKSIKDWESYRFCCTYLNRPRTKEEYGEDMLKMCIYYGCEMNCEINVSFIWDYFSEHGFSGYLYHKVDRKNHKYAKLPGTNTGEGVREEIFQWFYDHIQKHGLREIHDDILQECLEIQDKMTDFDLFVAAGMAGIANDNRRFFKTDEDTTHDLQIGDYFRGY